MKVTQDTEPRPKHPYLRMGYIHVTHVFWDLLQEKQWNPSIPQVQLSGTTPITQYSL